MISVNLALSMGLTDEEVASIQSKSLIHDIDEIWTGDMPSPHKESLNERVALAETRGGYRGRYMSDPPGAEDGARVRSRRIDEVIRGADRIDAWQWIRQYGVGIYKSEVEVDCWNRLSEFMEAAPATLEEAMHKMINKIA